ncbi:MAG: DMT family transporter [Acidimicrobiia bacterium]|nr:DMT family transporter [Acidimicrobiia bacterium]NNC74743.1 DMT family transporter [Acidimicrobiia bacterium]
MTRLAATSHGTSREAFGPTEWALLAAAAGIWGSSFLFIAIGLDAFSPFLITFLRVLFGALALTVLRSARSSVPREAWPRIIVLGLVWMAVPLAMFPIAQQWIDSALAGMLNGAMPLFSALVASVLLRSAPRRIQILGLVVGFAGVVLIAAPSISGGSSPLGIGLVLFATACYGLAVNLAVPLQQQYGALPILLRAQLVAVAALAPFGLAAATDSTFAWGPLAAVVALGVFGTGWAFVAMATLVGRAGATRGSVAVYFVPLVAIVMGVVFRDEMVGWVALVGIATVLIGAYLTSRREI